MEKYCDYCESVRSVHLDTVAATYTKNGKPVDIEKQVWICDVCHNPVFDEDVDNNTMQRIQERYDALYGLTGDQIKEVRAQYHAKGKPLSVRIFAKLMNMDPSTLQRQENERVRIPENMINRYRQLQKHPENIRALYELTKDELSARERKSVENHIAPYLQDQGEQEYIESLYKTYNETEYSGFISFDFQKFVQTLLLFAQEGIYESHLMQMLFQADHTFFKENVTSLTGMVYTTAGYSPVPLHVGVVLMYLERMDYIQIASAANDEGWIRNTIYATKTFQYEVFSAIERVFLEQIQSSFSFSPYTLQHNKIISYTNTPELDVKDKE